MLISCWRGSQTGKHRCRFQAPTHFKFFVFISWCRVTQTGDHRCRFQAPTYVNTLVSRSCCRGTQTGNHRCRFQAPAHFNTLVFSSCCRVTQNGNHRCIFQTPTHVNDNSNLHGTISTTTCTDIKSSTCVISNPIQTHDISPSEFKGSQSEATIHNTCWLLCSDIPTSKNLSEAGHQQWELYTGGA